MNFVNLVLNNGGALKKINPPNEKVKKTGLFNPSIFVDKTNEKIYISFRNSTYTLYYSENKRYSLDGEYLDYIKPDNSDHIKTENYICELTSELNLKKCCLVDTSNFDVDPKWKYSGLEDPRLVKWDDKFFLFGVRRDDNTEGRGRIEASEIEVNLENDHVVEVSRIKIPTPFDNNSYCEKNWMPILDNPYHFVKWTNTTELVSCSFENNSAKTDQVLLKEQNTSIPQIFRGGSQVVKFGDNYLTIVHEVTNENIDGKFSMSYLQRFVEWDNNWNIVRISKSFKMLGGGIEFVSGMATYGEDLLISFGFQDCMGFVLRVPVEFVMNFLDQGEKYEV